MHLSNKKLFIEMQRNRSVFFVAVVFKVFSKAAGQKELQFYGHRKYIYNYFTHANIKIIQYEMHRFK